MSNYIGVPIDTDPTDLAQQVFDALTVAFPGWLPSDGNLDVRLISAFAQISAETRDLASDVPDTIFQTFGSQFLGVTPILGTGANITATFTAQDSVGYTIPGGTLVQGVDSAGNILYWATDQDYIIPPASTSVATNIVSVLLGTFVNGTSYLSGQVTLVDDLEFILSIATTGAAANGVDPETDEDYRNRFAQELTLLKFGAVLPIDFAILAQNIAGVERAVAIDLYDPGTNTFGNAREVTVYVVDITGQDPGSTVRTEVDTYLQALREVNFIVNVLAPEYENVSTQYVVKAATGVDPVALKVDVDAAIANYLSPANWGQPNFGDAVSWVNQQFVRYSGVMAVLEAVIGVDHVVSLQISLQGVGNDYDMTVAGFNGPVCMPHWQPTGTGTSTGSVT